MAETQTPVRKGHRFGGNWTTAKLRVLGKYLQAYTTALRNKPDRRRPFRKAYIDAFAGTGYRESRAEQADGVQELLLPDLADDEPQELLEGSARIALRTAPPFDRYIYIERSLQRCQQLEGLRSEFPALASRIDILQGDANKEIQRLCTMNWRSHRAVLFLDPYGMQVEWETLEAVARTGAIDLWLLFPLGVGVNRLVTRSGDIPSGWRRRLDLILGTEEWYDAFYRVERVPDLIDGERESVVKASVESIGRYCNDRLRTIFPGVALEPGVLRNSTGNPLYLLCFAASNERGSPVALRIANHLLRDLR